jgi:hypothetical protein
MYFVLGGCWDGSPGLAWCTLQAFYEYLILLKTWEMQYLPVPELDPQTLKPLENSAHPPVEETTLEPEEVKVSE